MPSTSEPALIEALADKSEAVREVSARALADSTTEASRQALELVLHKDESYRLRYYALSALRPRPSIGLSACLSALDDPATTVQLEAARGLGVLAPSMSSSNATRSLALLFRLFGEYGDGCKRTDAAWGWRVVGNAIAAFGEQGRQRLEALRTQGNDKWIAWAAYQVLYVPQLDGKAVLTNEADAMATHAKYAPPFPGWRSDPLAQ